MFLWVKAFVPLLLVRGRVNMNRDQASCQDRTSFVSGAKRSLIDQLIFPGAGCIIGQLCVAWMDVVKGGTDSGGPPGELRWLVASSKVNSLL